MSKPGAPGQVWRNKCMGQSVIVDHWDEHSVVWHASECPELVQRYTPEAFLAIFRPGELTAPVLADWAERVGPGFDRG